MSALAVTTHERMKRFRAALAAGRTVLVARPLSLAELLTAAATHAGLAHHSGVIAPRRSDGRLASTAARRAAHREARLTDEERSAIRADMLERLTLELHTGSGGAERPKLRVLWAEPPAAPASELQARMEERIEERLPSNSLIVSIDGKVGAGAGMGKSKARAAVGGSVQHWPAHEAEQLALLFKALQEGAPVQLASVAARRHRWKRPKPPPADAQPLWLWLYDEEVRQPSSIPRPLQRAEHWVPALNQNQILIREVHPPPNEPPPSAFLVRKAFLMECRTHPGAHTRPTRRTLTTRMCRSRVCRSSSVQA